MEEFDELLTNVYNSMTKIEEERILDGELEMEDEVEKDKDEEKKKEVEEEKLESTENDIFGAYKAADD